MRKISIIAAITMALTVVTASVAVADGTCSGIVGEVHGQHVFGDYVSGIGHDGEWPVAGQANAAGGAVLAGGPGPGFHFPNGFGPGASFCVEGANSGVIYTNPAENGRPQGS